MPIAELNNLFLSQKKSVLREREREMPFLRLIPAPPFLRKVIKIKFSNPSCSYLLINLRLFNKEYIYIYIYIYILHSCHNPLCMCTIIMIPSIMFRGKC